MAADIRDRAMAATAHAVRPRATAATAHAVQPRATADRIRAMVAGDTRALRVVVEAEVDTPAVVEAATRVVVEATAAVGIAKRGDRQAGLWAKLLYVRLL